MSPQTPDVESAELVALSPREAIAGPIAANIAFVMELTMVPLLLPAIQLQFGLSIGDLAWVFNAYGIAVAVGVLLGGWCGDAFGTKRIFGLGVAFFTAGSLLVAASESFELLIIGRTLQGFGGGIFSPLVPLLLTRASPAKPGRVLILWGSIAGYVAAFAPLFYETFLGGHDWKFAFALIAVVAASALVIMKRTQVIGDHAPNFVPATNYPELFRTPDLWLTFIYVFCTYGSITYYLFRLPVWLSNSEGQAVSIGLALSIVWLTFSGLSSLLRNLVDGPYIRTIMIAAPFFIAGALPLARNTESIFLLVLSSVLVGTGLACSNAPSTQMILRLAPKGTSAVATSFDITFARVGGIATVAVLADKAITQAAPAIFVFCLIAALCAHKASKGHAKHM